MRLLVRDWPAILLLCIVSAVLAGICYRHHRRYADRGGAAWALFILVMGVPGAIGYWLHRPWPRGALTRGAVVRARPG